MPLSPGWHHLREKKRKRKASGFKPGQSPKRRRDSERTSSSKFGNVRVIEVDAGPYRLVRESIGCGGHGEAAARSPWGAASPPTPPPVVILPQQSLPLPYMLSSSACDALTLAYVFACVCHRVCVWWRGRRRCVWACACARASGGVVVRVFVWREGGAVEWCGGGFGLEAAMRSLRSSLNKEPWRWLHGYLVVCSSCSARCF